MHFTDRMSTGAAGDGLFKGIHDGCIPGHGMDVQNRPYHRNCGCALHKTRSHCSHSILKSKVSYPIRRAWSKAITASTRPSPAKNEDIRRSNSSKNMISLFGEDLDHYMFLFSSSKPVNLLKYLFVSPF